MRILFFIHGLYGGGAEHVATNLLNHFCEKHDTYVAITDFKAPTYPIDDRVHIIDDRIKWKFKGASRIPRFVKMAHTIKKIQPDIILSFLTKTNNNALLANLFIRNKIIVSERVSLAQQTNAKQRLFRRLLYPTANKIVFVVADDCKKFGMPSKSTVIYNPSMFEPHSDYNNRQRTIVSVSANTRWRIKGIDLLINAWAKIATQNPDWNLEIYGRIYGQLKTDGTCPISHDRAKWLGWRDDMSEMLKSKSIFALTSRFEACPNSLIEAMSQGCACLGTDCDGGIKEIITDGIDGIIAKNEDIDDIAEKLQMLINDENLRRRLSAGAIEKVKQFDKNAFFAKWDNLIEEVAKK